MGIFKFEYVKRSSSKKVCEDELTSRVFGILDIAGENIIQRWLGIDKCTKIDFWPKYPGVDPDLIIYDITGKKYIIECKLCDYGSVDQLKREYRLAHDTLDGEFIFITANITRPDILVLAEKEFGLPEGAMHWTTWTNLHTIISDALKNDKTIDPVKKELLIHCKEFLGWLKMGYNLGELMERYKVIYQEKWLETVSDKFKNFMLELKYSLENKTSSEKKYKHIRVASRIKSDLFKHTWIGLHSIDIEKIDSDLYYFIYFDIEDYDWSIILAGTGKSLREKIKEFLEKQKIPDFTLDENLSGGDNIGYRIVSSKPNFKRPDELKKEIVEKSLEFINEMNQILMKHKKYY